MLRKLRLRQKNGFLIKKKKNVYWLHLCSDDYPAFFRVILFSPRLLNKKCSQRWVSFFVMKKRLWSKGFNSYSRTFENIVRNKCKYWRQYSNYDIKLDCVSIKSKKVCGLSSSAIMLWCSQKNFQESVYVRVLLLHSCFLLFLFSYFKYSE